MNINNDIKSGLKAFHQANVHMNNKTPMEFNWRFVVGFLILGSLMAEFLNPVAAYAAPRTHPHELSRQDRGHRHTHESYGPAYKNQVEIVFPGLNRKGLVSLSDDKVQFEASNRGNGEAKIHITVDVQAHGVQNVFNQGEYTLAEGEVRRFEVPIAAFGIEPERLQIPAYLTLRVITNEVTGEPIDGYVSSAAYLHQDARLGLILYDETNLLRRFDGGDLNGIFTGPTGADPFKGHIKVFAGTGAGDLDPWVPPPDLSSGEQTICVHWHYKSRDHHAGEQYYANAEPMAARGVRLYIFQNSGGPSGKWYYANKDNGCISLPLVANKPVMVTIVAEAKIGTNDNILVRAYESKVLFDKKSPANDNLKKWSFYAQPGLGIIHLQVPAGLSSTLMALGSFPAYVLDHLEPIAETAKLDLIFEKEITNSLASKTHASIANSQGDMKFTYGHEIGHWYEANHGIGFGAEYNYKAMSPGCWSKNTHLQKHLLRSGEYNTPAFKEGLAHLFSTISWNGTNWQLPRFRYYKDMSAYANDEGYYADLHKHHNIVDMAAVTDAPDTLGGIRNWRDNICTDDDPKESSVELDWARFLINYLKAEIWSPYAVPQPVPSFGDLIRQMQLAYKDYYKPSLPSEFGLGPAQPYNFNTYYNLLDALKDPELNQAQYIDRWTYLAQLYGVQLD